jgi:hypothetical protein
MGHRALKNPDPRVAPEVHQDPFQFRTPFKSNHKIGLEEVDHADMELLCGGLYHPPGRVHDEEGGSLFTRLLFQAEGPHHLLDHVTAGGDRAHESEIRGLRGLEVAPVERKPHGRGRPKR